MLGLPTTVEKDGNLAAPAEFRYGIGAKETSLRCMVYLYVDYGIGEGIVVNGRIYRGADGLAGETGHTASC